MNWQEALNHIAGRRYATANDVRSIFADYHDALDWLAGFLVGEELAPACIIDACTIAAHQESLFHEWLAHWAARATLRAALQRQRNQIIELASGYEQFERVHANRRLLSPEDLHFLVEGSDILTFQIDVLCRFVLIMHGIAKESLRDVAAQLEISTTAAERAYCVAFDTLRLIGTKLPPRPEVPIGAAAGMDL